MIKKHLKQIECFNNQSRFKFILSGRRSGKSYLIKEDILKTAEHLPDYGEIVYFAPTNQMAIELIWEPLEYRLDQLGWSYVPRISKQRFQLSRKRKIYVMGLERHRRIRGHAISKAYLDEVAFYEGDLAKAWRAIRPTLADYRGGAIMSTTPNGKGTSAYDFYLDCLGRRNWEYFHWCSRDNPFLNREEIEDAKADLDERSFRQEFEATWESFAGLAYYSFVQDVNVCVQPKVDYNLPLILNFDFNVNPTTLLLSQWHDDAMRFKKEYSFENSSTEQTVINFCEDYKGAVANVKLLIRGDAAGSSRSSPTGRSDYDYVCEILTAHGFRWEKQVLTHNPAIVDRVKKVNAYLKPFKGNPKLYIDPCCKDLIKDLSSQETIGRIPSDKGNLGHKADACGYSIYYQDRVLSITPAASRIL